MHLTVTSPFAGHTVGDVITDQRDIEEVLGGEHAGHVVQTQEAE